MRTICWRCEAVAGGHARDFVEVAQAPLGIAPLERGVEVQIGLHRGAVLEIGAVQNSLPCGSSSRATPRNSACVARHGEMWIMLMHSTAS